MKKRLTYQQRKARKELKKFTVNILIALPFVMLALVWAWAFGDILAKGIK